MPQSDAAPACRFVLDGFPTRSEALTYSTPFAEAEAGLAANTGQSAVAVELARWDHKVMSTLAGAKLARAAEHFVHILAAVGMHTVAAVDVEFVAAPVLATRSDLTVGEVQEAVVDAELPL
jgi:hypothetical protein